jgi:hypothetical protein
MPGCALSIAATRMIQRLKKVSSNDSKQPTAKPVLLDAVEYTVRTIEDRARLYRNLVVSVSIVSILSVVLAVTFRQWIGLAGFLLLSPMTGSFLILDIRRTRLWRLHILKKSRKRELHIPTFRKTISAFAYLPASSLQAMLSTISDVDNPAQGQAQTQNPSGDIVDTRMRESEWRIFRGSALLTIALASLTAAAIFQTATLLICGAGLSILFAFFNRK